MRRCPRCDAAIFPHQAAHSCTEFLITSECEEGQSFYVEDPEYLMKKGRYTPTHETAAETWARWYNEDGDYALMNETVEITVSRNGDTRRFKVGAEPSIDYSVDLIETDTPT